MDQRGLHELASHRLLPSELIVLLCPSKQTILTNYSCALARLEPMDDNVLSSSVCCDR